MRMIRLTQEELKKMSKEELLIFIEELEIDLWNKQCEENEE